MRAEILTEERMAKIYDILATTHAGRVASAGNMSCAYYILEYERRMLAKAEMVLRIRLEEDRELWDLIDD